MLRQKLHWIEGSLVTVEKTRGKKKEDRAKQKWSFAGEGRRRDRIRAIYRCERCDQRDPKHRNGTQVHEQRWEGDVWDRVCRKQNGVMAPRRPGTQDTPASRPEFSAGGGLSGALIASLGGHHASGEQVGCFLFPPAPPPLFPTFLLLFLSEAQGWVMLKETLKLTCSGIALPALLIYI